ncbi:12110_t:CDS:10 [Rhizophagus irregularis]|nr:12110_t:CDS:10 [Rhizophagus irregularis]
MKLNHISLFITLSIILLVLLPVKSSIIFEENQNSTEQQPRVFGLDCYDDNTIVVRIVRKDPSKFQCLKDYLSIRTIYPNGTVKEFDLSSDTLNIQPFNFCILPKYPKANPLRFYPVRKNFLLITYAEADDINNFYTYNDWGVLGPSYVNITTKDWKPGQDSITLNVHRDNGFLRTAPLTNSTGYSLQQFIIDENGGIEQIVETINIYPTGYPLETVATMDGGYALIYPNNTGSATISTTPLTPQFGIYCMLLRYGKEITQGPIVLYQTLTPINVLLLDCDFTYVGVGQTCMIIASSTLTDKTFIKIDFLSSGTVYNITTFQSSEITTDYSIQSLRYGGYFSYYGVQNIKKNFEINGYIMDYYGNLFNWGLTYPTLANPIADILVLPNNTLVIPQPEGEKSWSLITSDLYKIEGVRDHGYDNLHIDTTIPKIGDVINPSETKFLIIKYYNKVDLSPNRNVTILQDDGTSHGIIRQMTSMTSTGNDGYDKFVNLIDDEFGSIINITIIDSTFNKPGGKYYVLIDDGFASSRGYHEPIIGIQSSAWNFTTIQEDDHESTSIKEIYQKKVNSAGISGKVRLTSEGTNYFKSIKDDKLKYKEFFDNLTRELAKAIPVSTERVTTSEKYEIDTSVSSEQYILSINIEKAKNKDEISVNLAAIDLDTLIKNKFITLIGSGVYSNYLDHKYGYVTKPRWIEENLKKLIITVLLNIGLLSFSAKEKNYAIYTCDLLIKIDELIDKLLNEEVSDDSDSTKELIVDNDNVTKSDEVSKELKKVIRELIINEDLEKLNKLMEEIKIVDEIIVKEKNDNTENETINNTEVKNIKEKLKVINKLISKIMQFEDFAEELKEVENLSENLVRKVNSFTVKSEEIEQLAEELNKIRVLTKKLKEVKKFAEEVSIFVDKRKLEDILIKGELKNIKNFADKLNSRVKDEKDDDAEDDIEEVENEDRNNNENEEKIKKWSLLNIINGIKEKRSHSIKQKKGYQKFSKWLKDSKEHRKVTALFVLLAGVNITYLRLLGSKMTIPWFNIYLNAKLSHAAKRKMIWGVFISAIIGDISLIILQSFYVTRVVSLGYTPVYNISKSRLKSQTWQSEKEKEEVKTNT